MARGDGGIGKADPWPTNEPTAEPTPNFEDGWHGHAPGGGHNEQPDDYPLDCLVYPDRPAIGLGAAEVANDIRSRQFMVSVGNLTGRKPGPSTD